MGKCIEKVFQKKKFTEAEHSLSQQCQLVHCYRWVPRTLTYWGKPVRNGSRRPEDNSGVLGSSLVNFKFLIDFQGLPQSDFNYLSNFSS